MALPFPTPLFAQNGDMNSKDFNAACAKVFFKRNKWWIGISLW
jgi:hypothetical protein